MRKMLYLLPLCILGWYYKFLLQDQLFLLTEILFFLAALLVAWLGFRIKLRFIFSWLMGCLLPWVLYGIIRLGAIWTITLWGPNFFIPEISSQLILGYPLFVFTMSLLMMMVYRPDFTAWYFGIIALSLAGLSLVAAMGESVLLMKEALVLSIGLLLFCTLAFSIKINKVKPWNGLSKILLTSGGLLLMVLLFFKIYEKPSQQQGGGVLQTESFHFDLTDFLTLQPQVSMGDELVLLFRKEGEAKKLLLRRYLLSSYDRDRGFFREDDLPWQENTLPDELPNGPMEFQSPQYQGRSELKQEYYLVNLNPSTLLAVNQAKEVVPFEQWEDASFSSVYQVTSMAYTESLWRLIRIEDIQLPPQQMSYYTFYDNREDLAELAESITEEQDRPYLKVLDIQSYLQNEYFYSLNPGVSPQGDQLGHFLFESKKGYCSYFAFAMTLMCRSLDIPARVALGFWVDQEMEVMNFYPVQSFQAHAWVEVYFNEFGWVEFDPTSQTLAPGEEFSMPWMDREAYLSLVQEILQNSGELTPRNIQEIPQQEKALSRFWQTIKRNKEGIIFTQLFRLYLFLLILQRLPLFLLFKPSSPRRFYLWLRRDLHRLGMGLPAFPRQLQGEHAELLPSIIPIISLYQQARFSEKPIIPPSRAELLELLKNYRRERAKVFPLVKRFWSAHYPLIQRSCP
ncbi:MAG: transglutaminase-like domain-containing protein [Spirochaetaceae bacterium]|jgi:transglutaminase-like putative cysteine protease|nr:transglutaminase-like domain-containing protein [Spirochaetaceae bacterium]